MSDLPFRGPAANFSNFSIRWKPGSISRYSPKLPLVHISPSLSLDIMAELGLSLNALSFKLLEIPGQPQQPMNE